MRLRSAKHGSMHGTQSARKVMSLTTAISLGALTNGAKNELHLLKTVPHLSTLQLRGFFLS